MGFSLSPYILFLFFLWNFLNEDEDVTSEPHSLLSVRGGASLLVPGEGDSIYILLVWLKCVLIPLGHRKHRNI